jgi:hypothetical protein
MWLSSESVIDFCVIPSNATEVSASARMLVLKDAQCVRIQYKDLKVDVLKYEARSVEGNRVELASGVGCRRDCKGRTEV